MPKFYGARPDMPDHRDHLYSAPLRTLKTLPKHVDLRPGCPPVFDQGALGSCTANAIAAAHRFDQIKQRTPVQIVPSRLFIYYNERAREGTISEDAGASLRDGLTSVAKQGVCDETRWPYLVDDFAKKPSGLAYTEALTHQVLTYSRITRSVSQLKGCLAAGYPFVFGFSVYESFESDEVAETGMVPLPGAGEGVLGGHAVMACGYDDETQRLLVQNSWGVSWGQAGFFLLPYGYITSDLAWDFWTIRTVEV